ncbi:MAG: hypothetical protein QM813_27860 [Verrucomicrobiota bacterium]
MKNRLQRNLGFLLLGSGALLLAFGIYGLTQPDEFRASAKICLPGLRESEAFDLDSAYVTEAIQSQGVLSNAIITIHLVSGQETDFARATPQAIAALRDRIKVRQVQNTVIFEIGVVAKSPTQAAHCANALVASYQHWWLEKAAALSKATIKELEESLKLQEQKVQAAEIALSREKAALHFPTLEPSVHDLTTNFPTIYEAKRLLDDEKDIQRLLTRKINIEKQDLSLNSADTVEIIESATPPQLPIRRKSTLGTILMAAGLFGCGWGWSLMRNSRTANGIG